MMLVGSAFLKVVFIVSFVRFQRTAYSASECSVLYRFNNAEVEVC